MSGLYRSTRVSGTHAHAYVCAFGLVGLEKRREIKLAIHRRILGYRAYPCMYIYPTILGVGYRHIWVGGMVHTHTRIYRVPTTTVMGYYYGLLLNKRNEKQAYLEFKWAQKLGERVWLCMVLF